jgi:hypothetical protein
MALVDLDITRKRYPRHSDKPQHEKLHKQQEAFFRTSTVTNHSSLKMSDKFGCVVALVDA